MEANNLRKWRFICPGLIAFIGLILILLADERQILVDQLSPSQWSLIVPFLLSVLYTVLNVRDAVAPNLFGEVNKNIESRLFALRDASVVPTGDLPLLQSGGGLMDVFWRTVDNDKSLDKRSMGIMFNGLFVSSLLDAFIVLLLTAPFGIAYGYWRGLELGEYHYLTVYVSGALAAIALVSKLCLLPRSQRRHLKLSNEQLQYIEAHCRQQVRQDINKLWFERQ